MEKDALDLTVGAKELVDFPTKLFPDLPTKSDVGNFRDPEDYVGNDGESID